MTASNFQTCGRSGAPCVQPLYTGKEPPANPDQCGVNECPQAIFIIASAPAGPIPFCKLCHVSGYCMAPEALAKSTSTL